MSVRHGLLGLLAQRPRHGYELHAAFEAVVGGERNWDVKPAQIYTTLTRLKESGLVREEGLERAGGPDKLIYAITEDGRSELGRWLATPVRTTHQRDEFFLKLMLTLAIGEAPPQRVLYAQRASLYQELHSLTVHRGEADPKSELGHILLLDQAIMRLEADLRWLDMIEARLDEIGRQPLPAPAARPRGRPPSRPRGDPRDGPTSPSGAGDERRQRHTGLTE